MNTSTYFANMKFFIGWYKRTVGLNMMWYSMWMNEVKKELNNYGKNKTR